MLELLQVQQKQQQEQQKQQQELQQKMLEQIDKLTALQSGNVNPAVPTTTAPVTHDGQVQNDRYKPKKPDRPVIHAGIDDREWALFRDTWTRYKHMCHVKPDDVASIRLELRAACSHDVNKLLFEYVGASALDVCTEQELLDHIKEVAVKHTHKEVHRVEFDRMVQQQGETITQYVARLKSKAFLCQFDIECQACHSPARQSYAEDAISTRLGAGLKNQEHQRKVLAEAAAITTLDLKVRRLQVLETTDESTMVLHNPAPNTSESLAARSQHKAKSSGSYRGDRGDRETASSNKCRWCGMMNKHPGGKSLDRANCPARMKKCNKCDLVGHLAAVCEKSEAAASLQEQQQPPPEQLPSESSVSFSFALQQEQPHFEQLLSESSVSAAQGDFRPVKKKNAGR